MNYYKVSYELSPKGGYVYPESARGVVWQNAHYHYSEQVMIGITEKELATVGQQVIKLAKEEATGLIKEFQASFPPPPEEEKTQGPQ